MASPSGVAATAIPKRAKKAITGGCGCGCGCYNEDGGGDDDDSDDGIGVVAFGVVVAPCLRAAPRLSAGHGEGGGMCAGHGEGSGMCAGHGEGGAALRAGSKPWFDRGHAPHRPVL